MIMKLENLVRPPWLANKPKAWSYSNVRSI